MEIKDLSVISEGHDELKTTQPDFKNLRNTHAYIHSCMIFYNIKLSLMPWILSLFLMLAQRPVAYNKLLLFKDFY